MTFGDAVDAAPAPSYPTGAMRERMEEFVDSAAYITGSDGSFDAGGEPAPIRELPSYFSSGLEISRSLCDRDSLIADIDLEYHNFDSPAEAWLNPARAFRLQQAVLSEILRILGAAGVKPLVLVSGRGFHLVWRVRQDAPVFSRLARLGSLPADLAARYASAVSPSGSRLRPELGRAFAGLGKLMEFVFHETFRQIGPHCEVPLKPAAIEVGPGANGREIVSFDISEYGDPLHSRRIRVPFSPYLKPLQSKWLLGDEGVDRLLPFFEIPLAGMDPMEAVAMAHDPQAVAELAARVRVEIPEASEGTGSLLDQYCRSALAAFHAEFEADLSRCGDFSAGPPDVPRPADIPKAVPCLQLPFQEPNDWLLKPGVLQHVTRVLSALGWRTGLIAQRIAASYRQDHAWGNTWERLEPDSRALFYTRLFTGMIATGTDTLIDMNCVSHQEKGLCTAPDCRSNLAVLRSVLLQTGLRKRRKT